MLWGRGRNLQFLGYIIIVLFEAAVHSVRGLPLPASPVAGWALRLDFDLSRGSSDPSRTFP